MEKLAFCILLLLTFCNGMANATVYEWTDANGVTNFSDNPQSIPNAYRGKAIRREVSGVEKGTVSPKVEPKPAVRQAPASSHPAEESYAGRSGRYWQEKFRALNAEIKALKGTLDEKQLHLGELHRKRVLFTRARDRVAINELDASIEEDTSRLALLNKQLEALKHAADDAGVPARFRE